MHKLIDILRFYNENLKKNKNNNSLLLCIYVVGYKMYGSVHCALRLYSSCNKCFQIFVMLSEATVYNKQCN